MTILLVDDDSASVRLYGAALHKRGFPVKICRSGNEVLELVRNQSFKLIVSDVDMPGLSGHEMSQEILVHGQRHCPVLFLSATDMVEHVAAGLRSGGDDFLIKGSPISHMMDRIIFWLTSGFRSLPHMVRLNILDQLDQMDPTAPLLADLKLDRPALERAFETLYREIQATDAGFGSRLVDRIYILGRANGLLCQMCDTPQHWLRFPDAITLLVRKLQTPWSADIPVLMKYYTLFSRDKRFLAAEETDLVSLARAQAAKQSVQTADNA